VQVPCNSIGTLCTPRSSSDGDTLPSAATHTLFLNGAEQTDAVFTPAGHACVARGLGCGAGSAAWQLRLQPRAAAAAAQAQATMLRGAAATAAA
jgi:hypothetical protein